jgi:hypothetical protein
MMDNIMRIACQVLVVIAILTLAGSVLVILARWIRQRTRKQFNPFKK